MNQALLDRVLRSPRLPSLPSIAIEVIDLVQQKDVNIKHIASTIQHDPALSSKILKTVNSSFYGTAHTVSTISHAMVILGLNSVKTMALGFSLVGNLKHSGGDGFDHMAFWKRSLYTAAAARTFAQTMGLAQQEEVFLGGLLQDLGMLAMNQTLGEEYQRILIAAGPNHRALLAIERQAMQTDHAEVGGALAKSWNLPPLLIEPIRHHEQPDNAPAELLPLVRCVALGNRMAEVVMSDKPAEALDQYYRLCEQWLNLKRDQAEPLFHSVHKYTVEMRRLFDLPTGDLQLPDEILARANEALLAISLQQQRKSSELEEQNRMLVEQASTDSLTGAANRRRFNEFLAECFNRTRTTGSPLSLLFFDTDHFKKFNDTYGHQVGDLVLVELAQALRKSFADAALVARYGGEEFAVVLPDTDRLEATRLAEKVRRAIEAMAVQHQQQPLHITASVGVATHEGGYFERPEQLVKAADQAVYAAKAGGRNCVRVFTPRPKAQEAA